MDTLSSIDTFRQVVESGSFVAAAARLEVSPATVSKRIIHVEKRLGVRLLNRNTRTLSLTDAGQRYFKRCKTILADLQATEQEVGSAERTPRGTLRVTCPSFSAAGQLACLFADYGHRYSEVLVDVSFEDRPADLIEEAYDVALRLVSNKDTLPQSLIARPIRNEAFYLAASHHYVTRRGLPRSPADLAGHDFVALRNMPWSSPAPIPPRIALYCRSTASVANAVAAGIGIGPVPGVMLEDPLFKDLLIPVLPDSPLHRAVLYIIYMRRRFVSPKVGTFVDFVLDALSRVPYSIREDREAAAFRSMQRGMRSPVLRAPGGPIAAPAPSYSELPRALPP
jgi:DNA-binding transcriptional LysR family regulator